MPYDPGDEDGYPSGESHATGSVDEQLGSYSEADVDHMTGHHEQSGQDEWGDELGEEYSEEESHNLTTLGPPRPSQLPAGLSQQSGRASSTQPSQPSYNSPSRSSLGTAKRVAVVLQSSPHKDEYSPIDVDDEDILITSDIAPRAKKHPAGGPSQFSGAGYPQEPKPAPFPIPTIMSSQQNITPQPKKRGRPPGWRPGSGPYWAMNGGTPRPPKPKSPKVPGEAKRRGRPPKAPTLTAREIYLQSNPRFPVFPCEWERCPAQLQNYDTLRAHVLIVHSTTGTCKWGDCASKHPEPLHLPDEETFQAHLDKTHLLYTLWQRGEGPQNTSIPAPWTAAPPPKPPNGIPPWLCNEKGEQVTPTVRTEFETDEERKQRRKQLDKLCRQRENNAQPEPNLTPEDWAEVSKKLDAKSKKQKEYRDYQAKLFGVNGQPPKYGPQWRGVLARPPKKKHGV
ncbi:hypothetical protein QBC34DRAFT_390046 [Podospora aff. communis PSN243]|uniref:C2H2-type domain-containing protein n=1 Tax=Podospora aff. communis PSN243 TaxID=3040156 RepID=A0AAV9H5C3_9PEZI|nr:hypothetical protein QBC34DRAFT_390046 [Podospora aff. communis PSN243]